MGESCSVNDGWRNPCAHVMCVCGVSVSCECVWNVMVCVYVCEHGVCSVDGISAAKAHLVGVEVWLLLLVEWLATLVGVVVFVVVVVMVVACVYVIAVVVVVSVLVVDWLVLIALLNELALVDGVCAIGISGTG